MKKLLVILTGLLGISVASISSLIQNQQKNILTSQLVVEPKEYNIKPIRISQFTKPDEWFYFAFDNINLTSELQIKTIADLHNYNAITIPEFSVGYFGKNFKEVRDDSWSANHNLGSETWYRSFEQVNDGVSMILERAATIWISETGDLMMRLAYHASLSISFPLGNPNDPKTRFEVQGGIILFKSGSVIKFS